MKDEKEKTREIQPHPAMVVRGIKIDGLSGIRQWLVDRAQDYQLKWLLAHSEEGVIWGKVEAGQLITSHEAAKGHAEFEKVCPDLRFDTLQQARLFSENAELLLWRDGDNQWQARVIQDATDTSKRDWDDAFDEAQLLWGTDPIVVPALGFTLWEDGAQGLRHAVPSTRPDKVTMDGKPQQRPPKLVVRHYLAKEPMARIAVSRLVKFDPAEVEEK